MDSSRPRGGDPHQGRNDPGSLAADPHIGPSNSAPSGLQQDGKPSPIAHHDLLDNGISSTVTLGVGAALLASTFLLRRHVPTRTLRHARIAIGCGTALVTARYAVSQRVESNCRKSEVNQSLTAIWAAVAAGAVYTGGDVRSAFKDPKKWGSPQEMEDAERKLMSDYKQARSAALEGQRFSDRFYAALAASSSPLLSRAIYHKILVEHSEQSGIRPSPYDMFVCSTQAAHFLHSESFGPFATWSGRACMAALLAWCVAPRKASMLRYTGPISLAGLLTFLLTGPLAGHVNLEHGVSIQDPKTLEDLLRHMIQLETTPLLQ